MHELTEDAASKKPGRSTGPRTETGKSNSSMNRLDHGLRSEKTILRDEDPAEYEATVQSWLDIYQPQDRKEDELVHEIIDAHWHLKRCKKRLEEVEFELPGNAWNWTGEHQKLYAIFTRYKTTAERSFSRWYKEMETYRGRQFREEQIREKALIAAAQVDLKWLDKEQARTSAKQIFDQTIEIGVDEKGRCYTDYFPTNQETLELIDSKSYTPVLMKRTLFFLNGVPPEYAWAGSAQPTESGILTAQQKMTWTRWLEIIDREEASGTGHLGPLYSSIK
jgi:hypothetical protein